MLLSILGLSCFNPDFLKHFISYNLKGFSSFQRAKCILKVTACVWWLYVCLGRCLLLTGFKKWEPRNPQIMSLVLQAYGLALLCTERKRPKIEDERSLCFGVDFNPDHIWQWLMTFADVYLNSTSVVLCRNPPTPCIWETRSPLGPVASSLRSKDRLVLFLPDLWYHPSLRTYMWSSAAGRAAHVHFTSLLAILGFTGPFTTWHHSEVCFFPPTFLSTDCHIPKTHCVLKFLYHVARFDLDAFDGFTWWSGLLPIWFIA